MQKTITPIDNTVYIERDYHSAKIEQTIDSSMKAQKEWDGGYECEFWYDSIIQVVQRILPRILKRQHKHLTVILESMLDDSRRLDWGHPGLHEGLTR